MEKGCKNFISILYIIYLMYLIIQYNKIKNYSLSM